MDRPLPLTREQVVEITGPLDDLKLAEIIATGASLPQITAAKMMLAGCEPVGSDLGHDGDAVTRRILEILQSEEPDGEDRER